MDLSDERSPALKRFFDLQYHQLLVEPVRNGYVIVWPDGSLFDSQLYKTAPAARRAITMLKKD